MNCNRPGGASILRSRFIEGLLARAWRLPPTLVFLCAFALAGCTTSHTTPQSPGQKAITELNLLGMPLAVNLDDKPGADGVVVKVFAATPAHPRAIPIRSGTLEIAAYAGTPDPAALPAPFQRWSFTPDTLARHTITTAFGTGYNLILSWIPQVLASDRVTLIARYHPVTGPTVTSAPNSITASAY